MTKNYQSPKAIRMTSMNKAKGTCDPGSGDTGNCVVPGNSAGASCAGAGNAAISNCSPTGSAF